MRGDFQIGDWLVQPQLNQLSCPSATVRVEPKAMAVLVCLAKHRDEVVSKQELKREVWPNTHVTDHVLIRCISDLRKALRDDPRAPKIIQTVSRGGYLLIPPRVDVPSPAHRQSTPASIPSEALQEYLKGRYCYEQGSHSSLIQAVGHLTNAIASYAHFARAYAALADCYSLMAQCGFENLDHCYNRSKAAALTALQLDDSSPEPHVSLALARMCHDLEWDVAEAGFRKATVLNQDYACAHHWLAFCLLARTRTAEAIREAATARSLDPVSLVFAATMVRALFAARAYREATDVCLDVLELHPAYPDLEWLLCECYWHQGRAEQALKRIELIPRSAIQDQPKLLIYHAVFSGEADKAVRVVRGIEGGGEAKDPVGLAKACTWVGDGARALRWLHAAVDRKDSRALLIDADPSFAPLRSEPQFRTLLKNLRLR